MKTKTLFLNLYPVAAVVCSLLTGCASPRPLRPGAAFIKSTAPSSGAQFSSELKQPENPAQAAAQNFERTTESELPLAAGTKITESITEVDDAKPEAAPIVHEKVIVLCEPSIQRTRTIEKAGTSVGAAQKDTAREMAARLARMGDPRKRCVSYTFWCVKCDFPSLAGRCRQLSVTSNRRSKRSLPFTRSGTNRRAKVKCTNPTPIT
jgi:hypothetical protein